MSGGLFGLCGAHPAPFIPGGFRRSRLASVWGSHVRLPRSLSTRSLRYENMLLLTFTALASPLLPLDDTCATAAAGGAASSGGGSSLTRELVPGETTDYFRISVVPGLRVDIQALFMHSEANIDLRLWNADCSVLLDESTSLTNNEATEWLNDTGGATEVVAQVFVASAPTAAVEYRLQVTGAQELCGFADRFEPNNDCTSAARLPRNEGFFYPLTLVPSDTDWLEYEVPPTSSVQFAVNSNIADGDTNAELWSGDCSTLLLAVSNPGTDLLSYANTTALPELVRLRVFRSDLNPGCSIYAVQLSTSLGVRECSAAVNSTGFPASLYGIGSTSVADDAFFLEASTIPMDQFGLYVFGPSAASVPLGNGTLCIDGNGLVRGPVSQALYQLLTMRVHLTEPGLGQPPIAPGTTLRFQTWFRDPGDPTGFGLSDALRVTFVQ